MRLMAIALAAFAFFAPRAEAAQRLGCGPAAAHTIRQSSSIRVFVQNRNYFACWRRSRGKPIDLLIEAPAQFRLRGRFLTYVSVYSCIASGCDFSVTILDVERRRAVVFEDYVLGKVRALVATRGGAAAFLADDGRTRFIHKLDSLGAEEIDRGPDLRALSLHGRRLHWLHGAKAREDSIVHTRRCGPPGGLRTEVLSRGLRVYYTAPYGGEEYHHFACLFGGGKPLFLGADLPGGTAYGYFDDFRPVGHHVFFFEYDCGPEGCSSKLYSADLVTRRIRSGAFAYHETPTVYPNSRGFAAELYAPTESRSAYKLYTFDSRGETLIDESAAIDPSSIVVYSDAVVWRDNGERRSAPLR